MKDFWNAFFFTYNKLSPDEKKEFYKILLKEMKDNAQSDLKNDSFIDNLISELNEIKNEHSDNLEINKDVLSFLNEFKKEIDLINDDDLKKLEEQKSVFEGLVAENLKDIEILNNKSKMLVMPIPWHDFEIKIKELAHDLVLKNDKLTELGVALDIEVLGNQIKIFDQKSIFSDEQKSGLKKEFLESYIKGINDDLGIDLELVGLNKNDEAILKSNLNLSQDHFLSILKNTNFDSKNIKLKAEVLEENINQGDEFIKGFEEELNELNLQSKKEEKNKLKEIKEIPKDKKINQEIPWTSWLENIRIENHNLKMSKDAFKKRFLDYCKNGMSDDELKILIVLRDKIPSNLSLEHREMINNGIKLGSIGNRVLNQDLKDLAKTITEKKPDLNIVQNFSNVLSENNPIDLKLKNSLVKNFTSKKVKKENIILN